MDRSDKRFLLPTEYCDCENPLIEETASRIVKGSTSDLEKAVAIFNWVRDTVKYRFDYWRLKASDTLRKRTGMCTNKANLQVALLRAVGIAAGYGIMDIRKDALRPVANDEIYRLTSPITVHIYCRCFLEGRWVSADTTVDGELLEAAYRNENGWERKEWDGRSNMAMSPIFVVRDKGIVPCLDEHLLNPPRFLTDKMIERANKHIEKLIVCCTSQS